MYKVFEKHKKLYKLVTRKLSEVELEREELSTKVDEANQTIRAIRFENNFLAKNTKKLVTVLFQVRAQLESVVGLFCVVGPRPSCYAAARKSEVRELGLVLLGLCFRLAYAKDELTQCRRVLA